MKFANPSRKDKVVATTAGHAIEFPGFKKETGYHFVSVPAHVRDEVRAAGMLPQDEVDGEEDESAVPKKPVEAADLKVALFTAYRELVAEDDASLFTATGVPKTKALERKLGYEVTNAERNDTWAEFMTIKDSSDPDGE